MFWPTANESANASVDPPVTVLSDEDAVKALVECLDVSAQDTWERMKRRGFVIGRKG